MAESQGAFLKNREAVPTALAGLELIHQVVNAPKFANHIANIAIKLDLSKVLIVWNGLTFFNSMIFPLVYSLDPTMPHNH